MANGKQIYFSDLVKETYKEWANTRIIFDGGTGTGKTYFVLNQLAPYAQANGKTVLYLCNRRNLKQQVFDAVRELNLKDTVTVLTYQALQKTLRNESVPEQVDYIVVDECHYFTSDAMFNEYTDLSYDYIQSQKGNVVLFMSATAKVFFHWLTSSKRVSDDHHFVIPKSYDYVDNFYYYDKKFLIPKLDELLAQDDETKMIVFCNSIKRMIELREKYGDNAVYVAAKNAKEVAEFCSDNAIYKHEDGTVTFDKRLLITTKVLDNGVDIKDRKIKHIFSEILDVDSAIQSLGRKRPYDDSDRCTMYLKNYTGQAIQGILNVNKKQVEPVNLFKNNYPKFKETYGKNRQALRANKIFYTHFGKEKDDNDLRFNKMRLIKYTMDISILEDMKEDSYKTAMTRLIGYQIADRVSVFGMNIPETDEFLEYLKSIEGKWLYKEDRKIIVKKFELCGLKIRREGICCMNGHLEDTYKNKYRCRFRNCILDENGEPTSRLLTDKRRKLPDGSINPNRDKRYWILE